ncbi:hypothetical protein JW826_03870 [Candidatus Woesearchaeota archaeon]|nr:hypothetical protein [Candidatus Woesearchaeota archaeon]
MEPAVGLDDIIEDLKDSVLREMSEVDESTIMDYVKRRGDAVKWLLDKRYIDLIMINHAITTAIFSSARRAYDIARVVGEDGLACFDAKRADSSAWLAYAIERGAFSQDERMRMRFEGAHSEESFIGSYGDPGLFDRLTKALLNRS